MTASAIAAQAARAPDASAAPASVLQAWRGLARRPGLLLAAAFTLLLVAAALQPQWLAPADPLEADARQAFLPPGAAHWLGTDENGRDVYTRIVHGVRPSLLMGLAATAIGLFFGVGMGLLAGLGHRRIDTAIMRVVDVLSSAPFSLIQADV